MQMQIKWFKSLFNSQMDYLEEYFEITEKTLVQNLKEFNEDIDKKVKDLSEDDKEELYEFYSDDYWKYSEIIPNVNRSSIFLLFYTFFEHKLFSLADLLSLHKQSKLSQKDISGKGIERTKIYFDKVLEIQFPSNSKEWNRLKSYGKIRNLIAHNGGIVEKNSNEYKSLVAFSKSVKNFDINVQGEIELNQKIIIDFFNDVKELFNKIYKNI